MFLVRQRPKREEHLLAYMLGDCIPTGYIKQIDASKVINVNINAVYHLINRSFIEAKKLEPMSHSRPVSLVKNSGITAPTKPRPIKQCLTSISAPQVDGDIVSIYLRNTTERKDD